MGSGAKIKGGDVLIFRMEILKIKGNTKRKEGCNLKTRANCLFDEVSVLDLWASKSLAEVQGEIDSIKKKTEGTLKKGMREKLLEPMKMLKAIAKAKKKGEEL